MAREEEDQCVRGKRSRRVLALAVLAFGCRPTESIELPEAPDAELAFTILYDDNDRARVISEPVLRQTVYSGRYSVLAEQGSLTARLYFVRTDDLVVSAEAQCATRERDVDRVRCLSAVTACHEDPISCLQVVDSSSSCGERIRLSGTLMVTAFESTSDGRLLPYGGEAPLPIDATLCGPVTDPPCANYVAGFIATVDGSFACAVPVEQRACRVRLDLSGCALGGVDAEVETDGALTTITGDCRFDGGNESLVCGETRYRLEPQDRLLGRATCPRHGPAIFNTRVPTTGRITGGLIYDPPGWTPRDLFVGRGIDDCASTGCAFVGGSCETSCADSCTRLFDINECALDAWPACVGTSQVVDCLDRCRRFCRLPDGSTCRRDASGDALTIGVHDAPEFELARVDLDEGRNVGATGLQAVARLEDDALAAVTSNVLHILEPSGPDRIVETTTVALPFVAGAVVRVEDDIVVVGTGLARFVWRDRLEAIVDVGPLPSLPAADRVVAGGERGRSLFLAGVEPRVVVVDRVTLEAQNSIETGAVTALVDAPGGLVVAAIDDGVTLAVLDESGERFRVPVPNGLRATALARYGERCLDGAATCSVLIGFERTTRAAAAQIGVFDLAVDDVESSRLAPAIAATTSQRVDLLLVDDARGRIVAISARRNEISLLQAEGQP